MTQHSIDISTAIERTEAAGVTIGGYTVRMTCQESCFRDPSDPVHDAVLELFGKTYDDNQFRVLEVADKGTYAVFDGYVLMTSEGIEEHINGFDRDLNAILAGIDGEDKPEVGLNIGFLSSSYGDDDHVHGPDCDH